MRTKTRSPLRHRAGSGWVWAGLVALAGFLLGGCGTVVDPVDATDSLSAEEAYISTLDVNETDNRRAVEARSGGQIISWHPEDGFAIVVHPESDGDLATQARPSPNLDVVFAPEASAGGVSAWAGGVSAWAGGFSAWAGGVNAWAGGVDNPFPGNENVWSQIGLGEAQELTESMGENVVVAVIDTGVDYLHTGIASRVTSGGWLDLVDGDGIPFEGYTMEKYRGEMIAVRTGDGDYWGHGTAVAGVILQAAPNARILPIRVLDSNGVGDAADVVKAIDHAVTYGAHIINLSLGTTVRVDAIDTMLGWAEKEGVQVVASSGNTGDRAVTFPAATANLSNYKLALGVGSVDASDRKSSFSTYGSDLEMLAPGEGIVTLYPGNSIAVASGTSFAAPWVSGTIALAISEGRLANLAEAESIASTAASIVEANPELAAGDLGRGRLDARAAIASITGN